MVQRLISQSPEAQDGPKQHHSQVRAPGYQLPACRQRKAATSIYLRLRYKLPIFLIFYHRLVVNILHLWLFPHTYYLTLYIVTPFALYTICIKVLKRWRFAEAYFAYSNAPTYRY